MEVVKIPVTGKMKVISVEKCTTANVSVFILNDYCNAYLFVRMVQTEHPEVLVRDPSLSYVTS